MSRSPLVRRSLAASAAATLLCLSGLPAHGSEGDPHGPGLTDLSAAADLPAAAEEALEQAGATHGGPPSTPGADGPATPAVPSGEPGTPATPATPAVPPVPDTPAEPPTPPTPPTPDPQGDEPEKDEKPAPAPGQDQDDEKGPDKGKGKGGDQGTGQPSPPGNNGTVKIAAPGDEAGHPSNNPHPGCEVVVEWFGYDAIEGLASTVTFTPLAPTADAAISGTDPATVNLDNDPAGGGTDLDGEQAYTLTFDGVPHPQQGYHVKLTVETPYSNGSDRKSKVFWVEPCEDTDQPPTETPGVPPVVDTPDVPPVVDTPDGPPVVDTPDGPPTETPGVPPVVTPPVGGPPPVLPPAPPLSPPLTPPSAELPVDAPPVDVPPAGGPKTEGPTPGNGVLGVDLPAAGPSGPTAARAGSGTGAAVPIAVAAGAPPAAGAASDPGSGPLALVVLGLALAVSARLRRAVGAR